MYVISRSRLSLIFTNYNLTSRACIEPKFYAQFLKLFLSALPSSLQNDARAAHKQDDREKWAVVKEFIAEGFMTRSRDEWAALFHGKLSCPPQLNDGRA